MPVCLVWIHSIAAADTFRATAMTVQLTLQFESMALVWQAENAHLDWHKSPPPPTVATFVGM
jgi:signal recognition particle GTPase